MSVFTFTDEKIQSLNYEINDSNIWNDVIAIFGESPTETILRGYSEDSIKLFGPRSKRLPVPLGKDQTTVEGLITEALDHDDNVLNPNIALISFSVVGTTDELIEQILTLKISDKVTVQVVSMELDADFVIDSFNLTLNTGVIQAEYNCTGLRIGE